jgi:hypothetical protein
MWHGDQIRCHVKILAGINFFALEHLPDNRRTGFRFLEFH